MEINSANNDTAAITTTTTISELIHWTLSQPQPRDASFVTVVAMFAFRSVNDSKN